MKLKKKPPPMGLLLSFDQQKRIADYLVVLIQIQTKTRKKSATSKRKIKSNYQDIKRKGSQIRGPVLSLLEGPFFITNLTSAIKYQNPAYSCFKATRKCRLNVS